jgi:hypothetical protein
MDSTVEAKMNRMNCRKLRAGVALVLTDIRIIP